MAKKNVSSIIADDWYQYMNYLSGGDNVINYSWRKKRISKAERKEIKNIFQEIDDLTGLTFKKTKKKNDDIRFFSVPDINETHKAEISESINPFPVEDLIVGRASARRDRIKIFFRDNDKEVTTLDKYVLRHEIGHALGLAHPDGDGANPDWNSSDTIMSYNVFEGPFFMYYGYTDTDKKALQQNWGLNPESYIGSIGRPEDIIEDITVPV